MKHLTLDDRATIKTMLETHASFKAIGRALGKDCTTISKEVRNHIQLHKSGCVGRAFNDCANRYSCDVSHLCKDSNCNRKLCRFYSRCHLYCEFYFKEYCKSLSQPPYVCNGCVSRNKCSLEKHFYSAVVAQQEYEILLSQSRAGICVSEEEIACLDNTISPLIKQGQSVHHIVVNNYPDIMFSEKTIYNYVAAGVFAARNIDLPRKVKYRPRKSRHDSFKIDKSCRKGRSFDDYLQFLKGCPDCPVVQMDSVIGIKGGKVLLTIHFVKSEFMLAFIRDRNTAASVFSVFELLYEKLSPDNFMMLFPLILTDNGSEFSDPLAIEMDAYNNLRTRIFYCNPSAPYQKGAVENNHEMIRRILPKGTSFNNLDQKDIWRMMNHINSYSRASLGNLSPYEVFRLFYGQDVLDVLGAELIPANEIILRPALLNK